MKSIYLEVPLVGVMRWDGWFRITNNTILQLFALVSLAKITLGELAKHALDHLSVLYNTCHAPLCVIRWLTWLGFDDADDLLVFFHYFESHAKVFLHFFVQQLFINVELFAYERCSTRYDPPKLILKHCYHKVWDEWGRHSWSIDCVKESSFDLSARSSS